MKAFKKVCDIEKVEFIEGKYDVENFFTKTKWYEKCEEKWDRCTICYDMRLKETDKLAKELWIKFWTTTLSISPHKDLQKIFTIWERLSKGY